MILTPSVIESQNNFFFNSDVSEKIDFELINNLIILPLEINGAPLSFVLDTGVSRPILFNLSERDSIDLKNTESFFLHGLGANGKIEALKSKQNTFKIGNIVGRNQDLYVVFDKSINFTPRLGILVHGIIGYDLFKDFIVEINYNSKFIRLHKPSSFKVKMSKKWKRIPITINRKKPYLDAVVTIDTIEAPVQLLIDTGSSDALWLFKDDSLGIKPKKGLAFRDYLGQGLSGSVYGNRSRVDDFKLGDFSLKGSNVAFPDSASINMARIYKERNGSLGGNILKRFNLFFNYSKSELYLKKNSNFKDVFTYNNSGIILEQNGFAFVKNRIKVPATDPFGDKNNSNAVQIQSMVDYLVTLKPAYQIVEVRQTSNAYKAGIRPGDILISINGKPAYSYKLTEINNILHGETGKTIRIKIERRGLARSFKFKLDDAFNVEEPSN